MSAQPQIMSDIAPAGALDAHSSDVLAALSDQQRATVFRRRDLALAAQRAMDRAEAAGRTRKSGLNDWIATSSCDLSRSQVYRLLQRFESDGLIGLIDRRGRPVDTSRSVEERVDPDAWAMFRSLYLTDKRRTIRLCYDVVARDAARKGWLWPGYRTITRLVAAELPPSTADYYRLGEKRWKSVYEPTIMRGYGHLRPNQRWVGDHCRLDFFAHNQRGAVDRPWLTAWMDERSRKIVGWHVSFAPNSDTILAALRNGIRAYGAPQELYVDNGKDYVCRALTGNPRLLRRVGADPDQFSPLAQRLGLVTHFATPYNARAKAIERQFHTMHQRFDRLFDTYCGGNPDEVPETLRTDIRKGRVEVPTLDMVRQYYTDWLEADYHLRPHSGDGMDGRTPHEVFNNEDPLPKRSLSDEELDFVLRKVVTARITKQGVRYSGVIYGGSQIALRPRIGEEVQLRIDPSDASEVIVCDLQGRFICRARNDRLSGMTSDEIRAGLKRQRKARKLARVARSAGAEARKSVVQHAIASAKRDAEPLRQAVGAETVRNVTPLITPDVQSARTVRDEPTPIDFAAFDFDDDVNDDAGDDPLMRLRF